MTGPVHGLIHLHAFRNSVPALGIALVFGIATHPCRIFAQQESINGSIRGTITDPPAAPIAGVTITVKNLAAGFTRQVTSNGDDVYLEPNLSIGTYSVASSAHGFAPIARSGVHLDASIDATVDQQLKLGSVTTEMQVTGDAPIIEAARFDLGRVITAYEAENLPLTSRNRYNFILLQPGVSAHLNTENGIPNTLNTNGLVDRVNYQLDDEVDTETDRYGLRIFSISESYVSEVQIISNSLAPELGNTAEIIYDVITRPGTNHIKGVVQCIWSPKVTASCPTLGDCKPSDLSGIVKPSIHVDDLLGRVGAPIINDKLIVYSAHKHLKRATPAPTNQSTALTLVAAGDSATDIQTALRVQCAEWFDVRTDYTINSKDQVFVCYNYFRNNYPFNTAASSTNALSAAADSQDRTRDIGAQFLTTFSPRLLNEFRASWPYRNEHHLADALTGAGFEISIAASGSYGAANFGGSSSAGDKFQEKKPSFHENLTFIVGAHDFKFGTGFQKNNDEQLSYVYTQHSFSSLPKVRRPPPGSRTTARSLPALVSPEQLITPSSSTSRRRISGGLRYLGCTNLLSRNNTSEGQSGCQDLPT